MLCLHKLLALCTQVSSNPKRTEHMPDGSYCSHKQHLYLLSSLSEFCTVIIAIVTVSCRRCNSFFVVAGSVLHLLTVVFAGSEARSSPALEQLMPRMWPLFRHPLARVRLAVVQCLQAFLTSHTQAQAWLTTPVLQAALRCKLFFDHWFVRSRSFALTVSCSLVHPD